MNKNGLLLIKKPRDLTSHDVVMRVRKSLQMREVGHAGTLDPLASGLMVILLGDGTKLSDFILNGNKSYRVRVKLGIRTDTLDITGKILSEEPCDLDSETIRAKAEALTGTFAWPIPLFSAAKIDGRKLYEMARAGEAVQAPTKPMTFWNVKVTEVGPAHVTASLSCTKGSFIRTWAAQLGDLLGVGGTVEELERLTSDPFQLDDAVSLEELSIPLNRGFISMEQALTGWPTYTIGARDQRLLVNGQISYDLERRAMPSRKAAIAADKVIGIRIVSGETGELLGLLEAKPRHGLKIRRLFKRT